LKSSRTAISVFIVSPDCQLRD